MLFYFTFRVVGAITAFLYPGYASFKTLSQRPASEAELERWLMYWSVLGCVVAVEYTAEWLISWIPFYYPLKTLFLLSLALPQTQGASYLYTAHLQPFFLEHEESIDAFLASLKTRIYTFLHSRVRLLWEHVLSQTGQAPARSLSPEPTLAAAPPTLSDPISGPAQMLGGLWRTYGPGVIATGVAMLHQTSQPAPPRPALETPPTSRFGSAQSVHDRRRQLEAELATLPSAPTNPPASQPFNPEVPSVLTPPASGAVRTLSSGSGDSLRERQRTVSGSLRFEEVEVPSDVEGYDSGGEGDDPQLARRTSWFGWGGGAPAKQGYERVKSD